MTAQEQQLITELGERIRNAPAPAIDRDAYDLILHTIGSRPDVLYLLTQTILIQEMALNQARAQIEELKRQPQPQYQPGGFLPQQPPPSGYQSSGYQSSGYQSSGYATQPPPSGGGFSSFLHNAATTAAGIVAGEIAFEGISSLFGHRGGFFGGGSGFFGGGGGISPVSETIVNNYYGDSRDDAGGDSRFADAASREQDVSSDIDDERDNFADNSGDSFTSDDSSFDAGGDSGDDGGSFDV